MRSLFRSYPILFALVPWVLLILCANHWGWHRFLGISEPLPSEKSVYYAVVETYAQPCPHSWKEEVEVLPTHTRAYLYLQCDTSRLLPEIGDTIRMQTGFNERGTAFVRQRDWQIVGKAQTIPLSLRPTLWQHKLYERYARFGLQGDELATTAALTLGYKDDLDKQLKSHFQKAGAAHILAVSGLHTGIVYAVLFFLFTLCGLFPPLYDSKWHQRILSLLIVCALIAYAAMTGGTPSVVRSVVFVALAELAKNWHRQVVSINTLLITAFLILFFRPRDLFSVSFQLSFAAVLGILSLEPALWHLLPISSRPHGWIRRIVRYIYQLLIVSIAAQVFTLPLTLYYFGQTSNLFFLTNLMVIPLAFLLITSGMALLLLGAVPWLGSGLTFLTFAFARLMNLSVGWVEQLPHAVSQASLSLPMMGLMFLYIGCLTILINRIIQ